MSEIEASAKAIEETAKTTGKAVDAVSGVGRFVARIIGDPLEEASGMLTDTIRYRRAGRALRLAKRYEEMRAEIGIDTPVKPISMNVALPIIEAAWVQEDDELQDMFARLLVNATNPESGVEVKRSFASIAQDFTPLSAKLLDMICNAPLDPTGPPLVMTAGLPDRYLNGTPEEKQLMPAHDVEVALWDLHRLGCIATTTTWGGGATVAMVAVTPLGRAVYDACTVRRKGEKLAPARGSSMADTDWGTKVQYGQDGHL